MNCIAWLGTLTFLFVLCETVLFFIIACYFNIKRKIKEPHLKHQRFFNF